MDNEDKLSADICKMLFHGFGEQAILEAMESPDYWHHRLPHLLPNAEQRTVFSEHFFQENDEGKIRLSFRGSKKKNRWEAEKLYLAALSARRVFGEGVIDESGNYSQKLQKFLGESIVQAVADGKEGAKLLKHLAKTIVDGVTEDDTCKYQRWLLFCSFVIDTDRLPLKSETKNIWEKYGEYHHTINQNSQKIATDKNAEKWRKELGLSGLPTR